MYEHGTEPPEGVKDSSVTQSVRSNPPLENGETSKKSDCRKLESQDAAVCAVLTAGTSNLGSHESSSSEKTSHNNNNTAASNSVCQVDHSDAEDHTSESVSGTTDSYNLPRRNPRRRVAGLEGVRRDEEGERTAEKAAGKAFPRCGRPRKRRQESDAQGAGTPQSIRVQGEAETSERDARQRSQPEGGAAAESGQARQGNPPAGAPATESQEQERSPTSRGTAARKGQPRQRSRTPEEVLLGSEQVRREGQPQGEPGAEEECARSSTKSAELRKFEEKGTCNREGLIRAQRADKHIKKLYDFMSKDTASFKKREMKTFKGKTKFLEIVDDIVYKKSKQGRRIYLPTDLRAAAIRNAHEPPGSGHFGISRTLHKVQRHLYWPRLTQEVRSFVRSCEPCQRYKPLKTKQKGYLQTTEHVRSFDCLYVDFEGPLVRTPRGNKYLLVFQCGYTRICELAAVKDSTAAVLARSLVSLIYARHGSPIKIISDSGPSFKSKVWKEVCRLLKIAPEHCTPFWPRSNMVERTNQTILKWLAIYCKNHSNWDIDLDLMQFALNNAVNATTGVSPFEMLYGRPAREVTDFVLESSDDAPPIPESEYVERLKERLKAVHEFVAARSGVKQKKYKEYYDRSRAPSDFKLGDLVLVETHHISKAAAKFTAKLAPRYFGPFEIVQQYSDTTFKLKCVKTGKILVKRHAAQLRHYHGRDDNPVLPAVEAEVIELSEQEPGFDTVIEQPVSDSRNNSPLSRPVSLDTDTQQIEPAQSREKTSSRKCVAPWCSAPASTEDSFVCHKCFSSCHFTCAGIHNNLDPPLSCVICRD